MNTSIFERMSRSETTTRSKSADFLRRIPPMDSSFTARFSTIHIDELCRTEKDERELNQLNHRFASYLNKIIHLGERNIHLRRQIDDIQQKSMDNNESTQRRDLINIQREMNKEFGKSIPFQTRLQRATYDKKYYRQQLQLSSTTEQLSNLQQQLSAHLYELNLLKEQHEKQVADLQVRRNSSLFLFELITWILVLQKGIR